MKNYLIYPCKTMNITQGYADSYSHAGHINGTPKDYPIDEACADSGRDWFYCPCDEMKVVRIYGVGKSGTNTIWLESTSEVITPAGKDYVTILITHPNDDDLSKLAVGQIFKRGEAIFREGKDGNATGNHFHIAVGFGKTTGTGWVQNTSGSWVHKTTGNQLKPEEAFYIDYSFTTAQNKRGLAFQELSTTIGSQDEAMEQEYVVVNTNSYLNVRTGPGTGYGIVGGYVDGTVVKVTKIQDNWAYVNNKGWCSLAYLEKVKTIIWGDIDGSGLATDGDARLALRAAAGSIELTKEQFEVADINKNGIIDAEDAAEILKISEGLG